MNWTSEMTTGFLVCVAMYIFGMLPIIIAFFLSLFHPDLISFLEERDKKSDAQKVAFLKKKLRKKKWRKVLEECLIGCRMEEIEEEYHNEFYDFNYHYLSSSFRSFWSLSSSSSLSEKEKKWVGEIEEKVRKRIGNYLLGREK